MRLNFHKLHGAANDFVVVDERAAGPVDWAAVAPRLCDRHRGVGADGVLLVGPSTGADLRMRLFNADGSEAEMCGNGIRCTAKFALDAGLTDRLDLAWETGAGIVRTEVLERDGVHARVRVDMGQPRLRPEEIPVTVEGDSVQGRRFSVNGGSLDLTCVSMGNPHAVAFVDSVAAFPLERLGPEVERHPDFPQRTNFEVVEVIAPDHLRMRVWERGVGETQACGTGACAVAVAGRLVAGTPERVDVDLPGGRLEVSWRPGAAVMMTGPAETVYAGEVEV
ncbi:MAG TPA: diaminopimelate epimerase [Candidatus Dormibacteraeota bacterium]|nr:diaminopimelate epimerase [Candidatus Dormibacteraeota bacterium]